MVLGSPRHRHLVTETLGVGANVFKGTWSASHPWFETKNFVLSLGLPLLLERRFLRIRGSRGMSTATSSQLTELLDSQPSHNPRGRLDWRQTEEKICRFWWILVIRPNSILQFASFLSTPFEEYTLNPFLLFASFLSNLQCSAVLSTFFFEKVKIEPHFTLGFLSTPFEVVRPNPYCVLSHVLSTPF